MSLRSQQYDSVIDDDDEFWYALHLREIIMCQRANLTSLF